MRPGLSRTINYFWFLSWISRCPRFVMDLKSSDPSLENVYLSHYYLLNVRLLTTAHYLKHPAGRKTARNLVSWFSAKSLKLLPPVVRLQVKCTKFDFGWGSTPDPAGGAYSAPPDPLHGLGGPTSKGKEGKEGKWKGHRGKRREEGKGEGCPGFAFEVYGHLICFSFHVYMEYSFGFRNPFFKIFSYIHFRAKMSCPPKLTELLRLWPYPWFCVQHHLAILNYGQKVIISQKW